MLLTPIHVQTYGNSMEERSDAVSFKSTKSKIEPYEDIPSVKQLLDKKNLPATI